jgi:hypothetical protein
MATTLISLAEYLATNVPARTASISTDPSWSAMWANTSMPDYRLRTKKKN